MFCLIFVFSLVRYIAGTLSGNYQPNFEYEYKVLKTLALLDIGQKKIQEDLHRNNVQVEEQMLHLQNMQKQIDNIVEKDSGSTYTRWGRTTCPGNGTELVYTGYVGGSVYTHSGAASNRLCMPKDPLWGHHDSKAASGAYIGGAEIESYMYSNGGQKFFGENLSHREPFCSVCMSKRRRVLMIPGRNRCYDGWTEEYNGYLAAGYYKDTAASEYLCLDGQPEVHKPAATPGQDGTRLQLVDVICGALSCPPYVADREVTCVVCTI